jgi:hypothetical protein
VTRTSARRTTTLSVAGLVLASALTGCGLVGGDTKDAFCGQLELAYPALTGDPTKALAPDAGAAAWKAHFDVNHQREAQLITDAPAELTQALTDLQTANDRLATVYADAEYDPRQIDTGLVTQLLHDAGYRPALDTVARYAKGTCHLD